MKLEDFGTNVQAHILRTIGRTLGPADTGHDLTKLPDLHAREVEAIAKTNSLAGAAYLKVVTNASLPDIKMYLDQHSWHASAD